MLYNKVEEGVIVKKVFYCLVLMFSFVLTGCFSFIKETAELDDSDIIYYGFEQASIGDEYALSLEFECKYNIFKIEYEGSAYDSNNTYIDSIRGSLTSTSYIEKDVKFTSAFETSYDVYSKAETLDLDITATAYVNDNEGLVATYRVTFIYNNGDDDTSVKVNKGDVITAPTDPVKENYIFNAWHTNKTFTNEFDFSTQITSNVYLYAEYLTDDELYIATIKADILSANITVKATSYTGTSGVESSGSGVIFHETTNYYYFLTNNHVTYKVSGYNNVSYKVMDYEFNYYSDVTILNSDANYDLSVGRFKKSSKQTLSTITLGTTNPTTSTDVICIGQPMGVTNTVSLGKVLSYTMVSLTDASVNESNVKFSVIQHSAESQTGSSGGGLYDSNYNLIGISYAGSVDLDGNFMYSYAIPIEKVNEFLNAYFWTLTLI